MNNDLPINLEECAREPIHIPGAIQPHGLLFVLSEPGLRILQVSENVERYLGILLDQLLGQELSSFLNPEQVEKVRVGLKSVDPREHNPIELQLKTRIDHNLLDGFVHRHDELSYLEVEPGSLENGPSFLNFYKTVSKLTSPSSRSFVSNGLVQRGCRRHSEMTGFDRVIVYRFADNHDGEVVSESKAQGVDSFLGLWYPASDIPAQARQLYVLNPIRNIVDVGYTPVPIVPAINPETHRPCGSELRRPSERIPGPLRISDEYGSYGLHVDLHPAPGSVCGAWWHAIISSPGLWPTRCVRPARLLEQSSLAK